MRWADFGPPPGNRPGSSISVCTGPSYGFTALRSKGLLGAGPGSEQPAEATEHRIEVEASGRGAELLRLQLLCLPHRVQHRRAHQVLERLHVIGIDDARIDRDPPQLAVTGDGCLHEPTARGPLD